MLVIHLFLVLQRLKSEGEDGKKLAQLLIETFITDMDYSLREMGVGDLSVGKKVRNLNSALFGRLKAYGQSIEADNSVDLENHVARSIYSDLTPDNLTADSADKAEFKQNGFPEIGLSQHKENPSGLRPDMSKCVLSRQLSRNLAAYMRAAHRQLGEQTFRQLTDGDIRFPDPMIFTEEHTRTGHY